MKKWEYMLIDSKKLPEAKQGLFSKPKVAVEEAEKYLNRLGEEGWEIIDLDFDFLIHETGNFVGMAKRPREQV